MAAPTRASKRPLERRTPPAPPRGAAPPTMTKSAFIVGIAEDLGCSQRQAGEVLNAISARLEQTLKKYGRFQWTPLGTFKTKRRNARAGRNPRTGAAMQIPARTTVVLQASPQLLKALN